MHYSKLFLYLLIYKNLLVKIIRITFMFNCASTLVFIKITFLKDRRQKYVVKIFCVYILNSFIFMN
jgi:hypothetical protein